MSAIHEFTGVGAIPAGPAGRLPKFDPKRKKKRLVDAFLSVPLAPALREMAPLPPAAAPATPEPTVPSAPPASGAPLPTAPSAPLQVEAPAPVEPTGESVKALMLSREVVEALSAGRSVNVRGILLEPMFRAAAHAPVPAPAVAEARVQAAVASVLESTPAPGGGLGGAVDMNATQPPPTAPSDGKAVMSAFRRYGGV